jgi:hypothetical protein
MWVWLLIQLTSGSGLATAPSDIVTVDVTFLKTVTVNTER